MLPQRLILIRHGESEGNLIVHNTRDDDDSLYEESMKDDHTVSWRLSKKGIEQAKQTGNWLKENTFLSDNPWNDQLIFKEFYVSDYARAIETAYELGLENPHWIITPEVRERMYGDIDFLYTKPVFDKKFDKNIKQREASSFHWIPQNGESISTVCERAANFIHRNLNNNINNRDVVIVTHGEFMWGMRIVLGEVTSYDYEELRTIKSIYNCQITEFSHIIGDGTYSKVRHYCPSMPDYHDWEYKKVNASRYYTNNDLSKILKKYPRLIKY